MTPKTITISDERPSLEKVQGLVGGFVQLIELNNGDQLMVNEDGIMQDLPVNDEATEIAMSQSNAYLMGGILGDVVILKGKAKWD